MGDVEAIFECMAGCAEPFGRNLPSFFEVICDLDKIFDRLSRAKEAIQRYSSTDGKDDDSSSSSSSSEEVVQEEPTMYLVRTTRTIRTWSPSSTGPRQVFTSDAAVQTEPPSRSDVEIQTHLTAYRQFATQVGKKWAWKPVSKAFSMERGPESTLDTMDE